MEFSDDLVSGMTVPKEVYQKSKSKITIFKLLRADSVAFQTEFGTPDRRSEICIELRHKIF